MSKNTFHAPYAIDRTACQFWRDGKDGWIQLTNFIATIEEELVYHDGSKITTHLIISGQQYGGAKDDQTDKPPKQLPRIVVTAQEFGTGNWISEKWGMTTIVYPTPNSTSDVRAAIQILSAETSVRKHIYTHTGWTKIDSKDVYLTASGGISATGLNNKISVQLPKELENYQLPEPDATAEDFANTMRLINIGPKNVTWVLLLATVRAALGNNDFAVHLAGRTGTFKSEVSALFQSFYGYNMDARHLPCSWNSTANALEALCYRTKDAIVCVDDFVPQGTSYNVRALQQKADALIRAQGNQTGRSRLSDVAGIQNTYFPRGIILSTGEDIPEGHSVRGRMMIVELRPGDIPTEKLTEAQANKASYPRFMASFIKWWAGANLHEAFTEMKNAYRNEFHGIGHARTPSIMGDLIATAHVIKEYADAQQWFPAAMQKVLGQAIVAITAAGHGQNEHLTGTDPVRMFAEIIRSMMAMQQGHMRTRNGGVPDNPSVFGWHVEQTYGECPTYKSVGPKLGWIDREKNELYFDPNAIGLIKAKSGGKLAVTNQILIKRMVEAGLVTRTDATRQRNTVRMTLEGDVRTVLILTLSEIMDLADQQNQQTIGENTESTGPEPEE